MPSIVAVAICLPFVRLGYTQQRLPNPRRIAETASDSQDLERPTTADQIPLKTTPSDLDRDRAHALALFGQARLLYQRGEAALALQAYQRAYHWYPDATNAANEVIPLAFHLQRPSVATRYALIVAEKGPPNIDLMRQVALHLIQQEKYDRAAKLYQRILKTLEPQPRSAEWVITHLELGRMYFLLEKYTQSAESFVIVVDALETPEKFELNDNLIKEILGKRHLSFGLFGEAFLEARRLDRAERMFRQAEQEKPNKPLFAYHQARLAEKRGQNELALQKLTAYLKSGSRDAGSEAYGLLQKLLPVTKNDSDNWQTRLVELHEGKPRPMLTSFLAEQFERSGDTSRALQLFQQLHETQPSAYAAQAVLRTAKLEQDAQAILDILGKLVDQTGSIELLDVDRLVLKDDKGKQLAAKVLEIAQDKLSKPTAAGQMFAAGLLAAKIKEFELADKLISTAVKHAEAAIQPAWQFSAALEMFMADAPDRAATRFERLAESGKSSDPSTVEFYWATSLELANQTEQATNIIEQAIGRTPDSPLLHSRRAWIAYHAEQNEVAERLYQQFLDKFGDDYSNAGVRELVKEAKMSMSNLTLIRKDIEGAIEWLQQILDEYPEDVGAMNDLGYLLADENRHLQRALRMVRFAVANEPANEAYLDSLGWALFRLQEYDEAAKYLQQAAAGEEPDGIILEHLGDVYDKMDQSEKAKAAWQRAAQALAKAKKQDTERIAIIEKKIAALEE